MADKPVICIDFDGVLHTYAHGWQGVRPTEGPVRGALGFVQMLVDRGYMVYVQSTRAETSTGRSEILDWLENYGFPDGLLVTHQKPRAILYIDDRGFRFTGDFEQLHHLLDRMPESARVEVRPWNRTPESLDT